MDYMMEKIIDKWNLGSLGLNFSSCRHRNDTKLLQNRFGMDTEQAQIDTEKKQNGNKTDTEETSKRQERDKEET